MSVRVHRHVLSAVSCVVGPLSASIQFLSYQSRPLLSCSICGGDTLFGTLIILDTAVGVFSSCGSRIHAHVPHLGDSPRGSRKAAVRPERPRGREVRGSVEDQGVGEDRNKELETRRQMSLDLEVCTSSPGVLPISGPALAPFQYACVSAGIQRAMQVTTNAGGCFALSFVLFAGLFVRGELFCCILSKRATRNRKTVNFEVWFSLLSDIKYP